MYRNKKSPLPTFGRETKGCLFKDFLRCKKFPIEQIDVPLLKAYQSYLKAEREISDRTIVNHLIVFSTKINESKVILLSF